MKTNTNYLDYRQYFSVLLLLIFGFTLVNGQCDTSQFIGNDLDGDGIIDTQDDDADNDGILNVDEYHCDIATFGASWGSLTNPNGSNFTEWFDVDGSGIDITFEGDYGAGVDNINTPSTQGGFLSLGMSVSDVNSPDQFVKFTFTFSEPIIVADFRIQDIDNESRFTTTSYNDQVLIEVFDDNNNQLSLETTLGANLVQDADGFISDPSGETPVGFGNTAHWATFETSILVKRLCVTYDPGNGGGIDDPGDQFISLADLKFCIPSDTDGDMIPDYLDLDSDNDGIPDLVEACGQINLVDDQCRLDDDGSAEYPDFNGDGCPDGIVSTYCTDGPIDSDDDGIPDFIDLDSDNDGCNDNVEAGTDGLGTSGEMYVAGTVDSDGLLVTGVSGTCPVPATQEWINAFASSGCIPPCTFTGDDKDNDGIIDEVDTDTDNDGIPNVDEYGCDEESFLLNWLELDDPAGSSDFSWTGLSGSDLNLRLESTFSGGVDGLGSPNTGSGFLLFGMDAIDVNQFDQFSQFLFTFSEPISVSGFRIQDIDNETRFNLSSYNDEVLLEFLDANGNILPSEVELGSSLVQLPNGYVTDLNGLTPVNFGDMSNWATYSTSGLVSGVRITYDPGNGGLTGNPGQQFIALGAITFCTPRDTDLDGIPDYIDLDSDNDGIPDAVEACGDVSLTLENCTLDDDGSAVYPDYNGDGCPDGLVDSYCIDGPIDTDSDGIPDYLDLDSDGDGCPDNIEAATDNLGTNEDAYIATSNIDDCGLLLSGISGICPIPSDNLYLDENQNNCAAPAISVVKAVSQILAASSGTLGNRDVTYTFVITNTGNRTLTNVSLTDDIRSQIGGAFVRVVGNPTASEGGGNPNYTGTSTDPQILDLTGALDPMESMTVNVVVELDPSNPTAIIQSNGDLLNQAMTTGNPVADDGTPIVGPNPTDLSDSGTDTATTNPGAPGDNGTADDPTPTRMPILAVNKTLVDNVVPPSNPDLNEITMRLKLTNIGNVPLVDVSLVDALDAPFNFGQYFVGVVGTPLITNQNSTLTPNLNTGYNGLQSGQPDFFDGMSGLLMPNQFVEIEVTFQIDLNLGNNPSQLSNQAQGSSNFVDPDSGEVTSVTDLSDDGTDPESTNPGSPGDTGTSDDPTPVVLISLAGGSIGDFVYFDADGDGMQDFGEQGIPNVQITLFDTNDNPIAITVSDANGNYLFEDIPAGDYYLQFVVPNDGGEDFESTTPFNGSNTDLDSDVTQVNGENTTQVFTLSNDQENLSVDGGFFQCVQLGDYTFYDTNGNSIRDPQENGINGLRVRVYRLQNGSYELFDETQTGHKPGTPSDDGYWKFCVPPGSYYVEFVENIQHLVLVQPNRGGESNDSDVTGQFGPNTTSSIQLLAGNPNCSVGAGYYNEAVIGDQVWLDQNINGIQDPGESGIEGIRLNLYTKAGQFVGSQVTNFDGRFQFGGLREDEYFVEVVVPDTLNITPSHVGDSDVLDSDLDNSNGLYTTACISTSSGVSNITLDIGLYDDTAENAILSNEWLGFSASQMNDHHLIQWSYGQLDLVEKCSVQRRLESQSEFTDIMTYDESQYSQWMQYEDYDLNEQGNYYYRVEVMNFAGEYSYTDVKVLYHSSDKQGSGDISVQPNPVSSQLTVELPLDGSTYEQISIVDVNGKHYRLETNALDMLNADKSVKINVDHLVSGVYFITILNDGKIQSKKFIKL